MKCLVYVVAFPLMGCGGDTESSEPGTADTRTNFELCISSCKLFREGSQDTDCPDTLSGCDELCESDWGKEYKCTPEYARQTECLVPAGAEFYCVTVDDKLSPTYERRLSECSREVGAFNECVCKNYERCDL